MFSNSFDPDFNSNNNLNNVYKENESWPHHNPEPPNKQLTMCVTHCIVVDSRDRDTNVFSLSNNFEFRFNPGSTFPGAALYKNFKNILEIKLVECILPKSFQTDDSTPYLILEIPELNDNIVGTSDALSRSFTVLLPDKLQNNFVHCRVNNMCYCFKKFNPPLSTLHKLTLKFNKPDGTLYVFTGNDDDEKQVMLIFEITTVQMDRNILNVDIIRPTQ